MKRPVTILIVLLSVFTLSANPFEFYGEKESWAPEQISISFGNDMWAFGGFSYNMDDQLSYSQEAMITAPVWWLDIITAGVTNRGWQLGWEIDDKTALGDGNRLQGRYDKALFNLYLPVHLIDNDSLWVWTSPIVGIELFGDLGFDYIQNATHEAANKPLVHIPYEIDGIIARPVAGIEAEIGLSLISFDRSWLFASARGSYFNTFGFGQNGILQAVAGVTGFSDDIITLTFGYRWNKAEAGWLTQSLYYDYLDGYFLGLTVNTGAMILHYTGSLSSEYGFGTIGFNLLSLFGESEWKESDIKFSEGIMRQLDITFYTTELDFVIKGYRFAPYLSNRFISGDPSFPNYEDNIDVNKTPRLKRSYSSMFIGLKYKFKDVDSNPFLCPYAKVGLGFMTWEKRTILNMVINKPGTEELNKLHSIVSPKVYSLAGEVELGVVILPEGLVKSQHTSYQLSLFAGLTVINNAEKVSYYLDTSTDDGDKIATIMPRWGITYVMGFDI